MKRANQILIHLVLIGATFIPLSCKKNNDPSPEPPPVNAMALTLDASAVVFNGITPTVRQVVTNSVIRNYAHIVGAIGQSGDYFYLDVYYPEIGSNVQIDLSKLDTWSMGYLKGGALYLGASKASSSSGASGILTISKNDVASRRIEGSFTGVMLTNAGTKGPAVVGSFGVNY